MVARSFIVVSVAMCSSPIVRCRTLKQLRYNFSASSYLPCFQNTADRPVVAIIYETQENDTSSLTAVFVKTNPISLYYFRTNMAFLHQQNERTLELGYDTYMRMIAMWTIIMRRIECTYSHIRTHTYIHTHVHRTQVRIQYAFYCQHISTIWHEYPELFNNIKIRPYTKTDTTL